MKKKLFALSGVFLIVLVITGFWATRATDTLGVEPQDPGTTSLGAGLSMQKLVKEASVIVIGEGGEARSAWLDRRLVTRVTVNVTETLKGDEKATVTVELPGGFDSNRRIPVAMNYPAAPVIGPGDKVFLFLTAGDTPNTYAVVGYNQGDFNIIENARGELFVSRDAIKGRVHDGVGNLQITRLEEFKEQVMALIKE